MTIKKVYQRYDETSVDERGFPIPFDQNNRTSCNFCMEKVWFNEWLYFNDNNGEPQKASYTNYWNLGDIFPVIHGDECKAIWGSDQQYQICKERRIQALNQGADPTKVKVELSYRPDKDQRYDRAVEIQDYYSRQQIKKGNLDDFRGADEL